MASTARSTRRPDDDASSRPRNSLGIGGVALLVGLGLVGTGDSDLGTAVVLAALIVLIYGVHAFGRLGPDVVAASKRGRPSRDVADLGP